jgi:ornithine cyclodeaminase
VKGDARTIELPAIRSALTRPLILEAVRESLIALASGKALLPRPISVEPPGGEIHLKGAWLDGATTLGFKISCGFHGNEALGVPVNSGFSFALDARTGQLAALLFDNGWLTEMRTAAAGALAAEYLSRPESATLGLIGAGLQARYQLEALRDVRSISEVRVWSRTRERAERFVLEQAAQGISVTAVESVRSAVDGADIVVTATSSRAPLIQAEWVSPGTHITAMGSDSPGKQELDVEVLVCADLIVADQVEGCAESGELQHAVKAQRIDLGDVVEFSDLAAGLAPGRTNADQITVADQCGLGIYDAAMVDLVMKLCD